MKTLVYALLGVLLVVGCQPTPPPAADPGPSLTDRAQKLYADFAAGNVEAVVAQWDSTIIWNEAENFIYADGNPYIGPNAVLEGVFGRIGQEWENFRLGDFQFHSLDSNGVLVTGKYRGTFKANGGELDAQFAHVWMFRDTLVVSFQQYTDTHQAQAIVATEADTEE